MKILIVEKIEKEKIKERVKEICEGLILLKKITGIKELHAVFQDLTPYGEEKKVLLKVYKKNKQELTQDNIEMVQYKWTHLQI